MTPTDILQQGMKTFEERGQLYGDPKELFQKIATLFRVLTNKDLDAEDVVLIMILMKLARAQVSPENQDHTLDAATYTAIYGSLSVPQTPQDYIVKCPQYRQGRDDRYRAEVERRRAAGYYSNK